MGVSGCMSVEPRGVADDGCVVAWRRYGLSCRPLARCERGGEDEAR